VFIRWALLVPPIGGMWLVLELFRAGVIHDSVATGAQITLLRSFKDDEAGVDYGGPVKPDPRWQQVRLEPQITHELRRFGPVVAISGDARTIDRTGARRVQVNDDVWQSVVTRWIDASMMIVMLAGTTPSVRWELETIIARDRVGSLFILFPPRTTDALGRVENDDKIDRLGIVRNCFDRTPWVSALGELHESGAIGLTFRPGGKLEAITSASFGDEDDRLAICFAVTGCCAIAPNQSYRADAVRATVRPVKVWGKALPKAQNYFREGPLRRRGSRGRGRRFLLDQPGGQRALRPSELEDIDPDLSAIPEPSPTSGAPSRQSTRSSGKSRRAVSHAARPMMTLALASQRSF
jgi:hypothetical protein